MTPLDPPREPRFYVDEGRIYDREWPQPGYVVKVWSIKAGGVGLNAFGLTDRGPEVDDEARRICLLLNEARDARARLAEVEADNARLRQGLEGSYYEAMVQAQDRAERLRAAALTAVREYHLATNSTGETEDCDNAIEALAAALAESSPTPNRSALRQTKEGAKGRPTPPQEADQSTAVTLPHAESSPQEDPGDG